MSEFEIVKIRDLKIDPAYQRELQGRRVELIAKEFDPAILGVLEVSKRSDGVYYVFDGQHRFRAMKLTDVENAPCLVHKGLTQKQEAELFVRLQTERSPIKPLERFKARLVYAEPAAVEIDRLARTHGLRIGPNPGVTSIATIDKVFERDGSDVLDKTLEIVAIWKGEPRFSEAAIIQGVSIVARNFGNKPSWARVAPAMERVAPATLLRKAHGRRLGVASAVSTVALGVSEEIRKAARIKNSPVKPVEKVEAE